MNEYTAHVQVPDAVVGAVLQVVVLEDEDVRCSTLRSGSGSWLSIGFEAETDDSAVFMISAIRYQASQAQPALPDGYDSLEAFESAPMIITSGRTVLHSQGV